jgi:hypothetical protein
LDRPADTDVGVIPSKASVMTGRIILVDFIHDFGAGGDGAKTVRETFWNEQHGAFFISQFKPIPLTERRRVFTEINDNVENSSANNAYQFALSKRRALKMHSPQHTVRYGHGMIVLNKYRRNPGWTEILKGV